MNTNNEFQTLSFFSKQTILSLFIVVIMLLTSSCGAVLSSINMPPYKSKLTTPADNAINVQINAILEWEASHDPEGKALFYTVYLDTKTPPKAKVATDLTDTNYQVSLKSNTVYYWQVIVRDEGNSTNESEIGRFTTKKYSFKKK